MYDMLPLTQTLFRRGTHMYEDKETRRKRRRRRRKRKSRRKGRRSSKRIVGRGRGVVIRKGMIT